MLRYFTVLLLIFVALPVASCSADDPIRDPTYINSLYVQTINGTPYAPPAHGQLWNDMAPSSVNITVAGNYYRVGGWTGASSYYNTASAAGANITIDSTGAYLVQFSVGASNSGANRTVHLGVFVDGIAVPNVHMEGKTLTAGDLTVVSTMGIVNLVKNDVLDLRVTSSVNGDVMTFDHASLTINRIGL